MNERPHREERDEQVARLLDRVELEHGPGYWNAVRAAVRLQPSKRLRPPFWARRRYQLGFAIAVVAAAVAAVLIGLPGHNGQSPSPASAAQLMLARIDFGLSSTTTVQGNFAELTTVYAAGHAPAWARWHGSFAADAAGDSRYEIALSRRSAGVGVVSQPIATGPAVPASDRPHAIWTVLQPVRYVSLYQASAMAARWAAWDSNGKLIDHGSATRWPASAVRVSPWDDLLQFWLNNLGQAALVHAAVAGAADLPVRTVRYEGRPAWQATIDLLPSFSRAPHYYKTLREVVTVDQATGFIVRTVLQVVPGPASRTPGFPHALSPYIVELRISNLRTGAALPASSFTELPKGVPNPSPTGVYDTPAGQPVTSSSLPKAAVSAGFAPLVPNPLPAGFALSAASSDARMGSVSLITQFVPATKEVDELYRRGFEWFELDVIPWDGTGRDVSELRGMLPKPRVVVLHGGSQAGASAYLWQGSMSGNAALGRLSDHGMLPLAVSSTLTFYGKGYCVYLRGNVPSNELLTIANSLQVAAE